jgi:hypothetical protein
MIKPTIFFSLFLSLPAMASPLSVEVWNMPFSQHTIAGGSLPFSGRIFWSSFLPDNDDAVTPEGIRFRGITCMDGADEACREQLESPKLLDPLTMRMTNFYFTCDNPDGCPAFEVTLVADFILNPGWQVNAVYNTSFQIEGCTEFAVTPSKSIPGCDAGEGGPPMTIAYYFGFTTSDRFGGDSVSVEYGDINELVGVNGVFNITGGGRPIPMNERIILTQQFLIGGLPAIDSDGNWFLAPWSGSIKFPGSILGTIETTSAPSPVPEPGTLTAGVALLAAGLGLRRRATLPRHGRRRMR